ncbi:MAG: hypothetical protein ACJ741_16590, partial [Pyrinomonadaceae bacterium]
AIPHADSFSFTARGAEWVTHEWLTELVMYATYKLSDWDGLVVLFSLLMTAALWLAYRRALLRGAHNYVACAATLIGALATAPIWGVRPQMISFLFTSVFIFALERDRRDEHPHPASGQDSGARRRRLWLMVPLMLVWVNMHAGFALGLAVIALFGAGIALDESLGPEAARLRRIWVSVRPLCAVFAACIAVVPLNPSGFRLFSYPFETINSHAMQKYIAEWLSPDFHQTNAHALALLLFATFVALALSPKRVRTGELLLLCVSAYAALRAWRNIPFFALVAVPVLAEHAWSLIQSRVWARRGAAKKRDAGTQATVVIALNAALLVLLPLGLCAARVASVARSQQSVEAKEYPAAAVEFLRAHRDAGKLFNAYGWGGYIIWKLYPDRPVFIDGRADVYGDAMIEEYLSAENGEQTWRATLDAHDVRTVLIRPDTALASLLREDAGWKNVYEDKQAVIFFRN